MLVGSLGPDGTTFRIHCHVLPDREELTSRHRVPRRAARRSGAGRGLRGAQDQGSCRGGPLEPHQYTYRKQAWISDVHRRLGVERRPITPPATIGILGGGQLGRMLGLAARAMGYRLAVLDPDPDCPAAGIADRMVVAGYDDVGAALRLAELSDVVTYELEHVAPSVVDAIDVAPAGPAGPVAAARDAGPARRAAVPRERRRRGGALARGPDDRRPRGAPRTSSGCRCGSRSPRAATTVAASSASPTRDELGERARAARAPAGEPLLAEAELAFEAELSIVVARSVVGGSRPSRSRATGTTAGSSSRASRRRPSIPSSP